MGWTIINNEPIDEGSRNYLINNGHTIIDLEGYTTEELLAKVKDYRPDALMIRLAKVTAEVFEAGAPKLKCVARRGVGFDNLDMDAAAKYKVQCVYAPEGNSTSVSEVAMLHILYASKNVTRLHKVMVNDYIDAKHNSNMHVVSNHIVGIIGCGNIGRRVARRAMAMDMYVMAYDPFLPAAAFPDGVEVVRDLDTLLAAADYVTVHVPNTVTTKKMVNAEFLSKMKPTAFLINTARGALVDEDALYEACKNGVIAGAGLDTVAKEPFVENFKLLELPNIMITPHIGGSTLESIDSCCYMAAIGIQEVYEGKAPSWPIIDKDYSKEPTYTDTKKPENWAPLEK